MKILYLAAGKGIIDTKHTVIYQDKFIKRHLQGDMLETNLEGYDIIIATPPCTFYTRCLSDKRKQNSINALTTKHLLPSIIKILSQQNKPFLIENVRSKEIDKIIKSTPNWIHVYQLGRHTYWTNILVNFSNIPQHYDFRNRGIRIVKNSQGGTNVQTVIETFIKVIES